jgi:hypothetical protein
VTIRPVPIRDAFKSVGNATDFLISIVVILGGYSALSAQQGDAIVGLLGAIPGLVTLAGDVYRSFKVKAAIAQAESKVTPLSDPMDNEGNRLLPLG